MPHISSKQIKRKVFEKIHDQFVETVSQAGQSKLRKILNAEILTPTEHLMIAKRLAIILMCLDKYSSYRIIKVLRVSSSTVTRIRRKIEHGDFNTIITLAKKQKNRELFWQHLGQLSRLGLPPKTGPGRWRTFYKNQNKQ